MEGFWTWHEPNHSKAEPPELEQMYKKTKGRWQPAPGTAAGETCFLTKVQMRLKSLLIPPLLCPPPKNEHKGDICRVKFDSKSFSGFIFVFLMRVLKNKFSAITLEKIPRNLDFYRELSDNCCLPSWKELKCREQLSPCSKSLPQCSADTSGLSFN